MNKVKMGKIFPPLCKGRLGGVEGRKLDLPLPLLTKEGGKAVGGCLLLAVAVFFISLRFVCLAADPPELRRGDWHRDFWDEGDKLHSAAAYVLEGKWMVDGWTGGLYPCPLFALVNAGWFKLWGTDLVTARALSALLSIMAIVVFGLLVRRLAGNRLAVISALLVAFNFPYWVHSRLAEWEGMMIPLVVGSIFFWVMADRQRISAFLSGAMLAAGFFVKPLAVVAGGILVCDAVLRLFLRRQNAGELLQQGTWFVLGLTATLVIGFFACQRMDPVFWGVWQLHVNANTQIPYPTSIGRVLWNIQEWGHYKPYLFFLKPMPVLTMAAFLGILLRLKKGTTKRSWSRADILFGSWMVVWLAFLALAYPTERTRYYLELIFPMCYFAAELIHSLWVPQPLNTSKGRWLGSLKRSLGIGVILALFVIDGTRYVVWISHISYSFREAAIRVAEFARNLNCKVSGGCALSLMLDQGVLAYGNAPDGFSDNLDWFCREKEIRLFVINEDLISLTRAHIPNVMSAAQPFAFLNVHTTPITVLYLDPQKGMQK